MSAFLGWQDRIKNATLSGGNWTGGLPLANLRNWPRSRVARSSSLVGTLFDFDLGAACPLRAGMLAGHNLSPAAQWRLTLGSTPGGSNLFNSGWQPAWFLSFDNSWLEWESASWWEGSVDPDLSGAPYHLPMILPDWIAARYGRLELSDPGNPAGYVQAGRFVLCSGIKVLQNRGEEDSWRDLSIDQTMASGVRYTESRDALRQVKLQLDWIDRHAEAGEFYELQRSLRTVGDVLYLPDLSDYQACQRSGFIGRLTELSPITHPLVNYSRAPIQIEEMK